MDVLGDINEFIKGKGVIPCQCRMCSKSENKKYSDFDNVEQLEYIAKQVFNKQWICNNCKPKSKCKNCGRSDIPLWKCKGCSKAYYCNRDCQRGDWKFHKAWCTQK